MGRKIASQVGVHDLLKQHLDKAGLSKDSPPKDKKAWQAFLKSVEETYAQVESNETQEEIKAYTKVLEQAIVERTELLAENEARYRDLLDNANVLIQSIGPAGTFVYVNKRWQEVMGYTEEEARRLHFKDVLRPDQVARYQSLYKRLQQGKSFRDEELIFVTRAGDEIILEGNLSARMVGGRFISTQTILRDVTERREMEEALYHNRRTMHLIISSMPSLLLVLDDQNGLSSFFVPPHFPHILQHLNEEPLGKQLDYVMPPSIVEETQRWVDQARKIRDTCSFEAAVPLNQGGVHLDIRISPITDSDDMLIVIDDISERKRMETALEDSERRYRQIVEEASDVVFVADMAGYLTYINPPVTRMTGYPITDLLGKHFTVLLPESYRLKTMAFFRRQLRTRQAETLIEFPIITREGEERWVEQVTTIVQEGSQVVGLQGIVRDVTERKQAEVATQLAHERAIEALHLKDQIVANVSHDLRTPLTSIMGYSDIMLQGVYGPLHERQERAIRRIDSSARQLLSLVNDLLDKAQIESGMLTIKSELFPIAELLNGVISMMGPQAETRGLELVTIVDDDMPQSIVGDQRRLEQILNNLVGNALKFTEEGGVEITISNQGDGHYALKVTDTGPGIPEAARQQIFDAFYQVNGSVTRKHGGVGLGLSIVQQLTSLMGGQVTLDSEVGQGSTFTVVLPLKAELKSGKE
jgi:PAS domain S-box-containing protein